MSKLSPRMSNYDDDYDYIFIIYIWYFQITNLPVNNEPGVLMFKFTCGLQCRLFMNPTTFQSLCLKVLPVAGESLEIRS